MIKNELKEELKIIAVRSIFLDIAVFFISTFFIGFKMSMVIGLTLGTAVMLINMGLLCISVENVLHGNAKQAPFKMTGGYVFRLILVGLLFFVSIKTKFIHPLGVITPVFYPKLIYTFGIFLNKKGGS